MIRVDIASNVRFESCMPSDPDAVVLTTPVAALLCMSCATQNLKRAVRRHPVLSLQERSGNDAIGRLTRRCTAAWRCKVGLVNELSIFAEFTKWFSVQCCRKAL